MKYIINLNGIILCPYQALLDLSLQIPNSPPGIAQLAFSPICDLNSTNDWINLESLGKPVAIRAKLITDFVYSLVKTQDMESISLEIYIDRGPLLSDNLFCLLYLAQYFKNVCLCFYTEPENVALLKQSLESLQDKKNCTLSFKTKVRKSPVSLLTQLKNHRYQAIQSLGLSFDDQFFSQKSLSESQLKQVIAYSWLCLKSGGYDISCHLLETAYSLVAKNRALKEQTFMHLLLIRFFSHQYSVVANTKFPRQLSTLDPSEINTLQFLKAYSATLKQNLKVARDYFLKCNINENASLHNENSLYQLNLFSLYKLVQGDVDKAFELQFRIKQFIEDHQIETVGLKFFNLINLANLFHQTERHEDALDFYHKAYTEISGGGYTTSDHIYYNMNLASLCEAQGNSEQALVYWIKTAMHWLACKNKYELSWRPRIILCQETISDIAKPLPIEKANSFLLDKIQYLLQLCDVELTHNNPKLYQYIDDTFNIRREQCFIYKNILLYTGQGALNIPGQNSTASEKSLSLLISRYIHTFMDIPQDQNIFIVDTHLDTKFIQNAEQAMAFAHLSNCFTCYYNGQWIKLDDFASLRPMLASLSKIIHSISRTEKGLLVNYKRSFLNKTILEQGEIDIVNLIEQNNFLSLDRITNSMWNNVHQLAKKRILSFSYPE